MDTNYISDDEWFDSIVGTIVYGVMSQSDPNAEIIELPDHYRIAFHVGQFIVYYHNSGLDGYLTGPHGDELENCLNGVKMIGANSTSDLLEAVRSVLAAESSVAKIRDISKSVRIICEINNVNRIEDIDGLKNQKVDENIISLLRRYFQSQDRQANHTIPDK